MVNIHIMGGRQETILGHPNILEGLGGGGEANGQSVIGIDSGDRMYGERTGED